MKIRFFLFEAPLNQGTYCDDHKLLIKQDRKEDRGSRKGSIR